MTKSAETILDDHLKACYEVHNIKISDKYRNYLLSAMKAHTKQWLDRAMNEAVSRMRHGRTSAYPEVDKQVFLDLIKEMEK